MRAMGRGALIVLEGCDKAGKSTQAKLLVDALNNKCDVPTEFRQFPNRETSTGCLINQYLKKQLNLPKETVHLLFSANRWECKDDIIKALESGKTVIVDRYAASGAAYAAVNTGRDLNWCTEADKGLPAPDLVIFLKVDEQSQEQRSGWGEEVFENKQFQQKVANNFHKLADESWKIIENKDIETTHNKVLEAVLSTITLVKGFPIKSLYES